MELFFLAENSLEKAVYHRLNFINKYIHIIWVVVTKQKAAVIDGI